MVRSRELGVLVLAVALGALAARASRVQAQETPEAPVKLDAQGSPAGPEARISVEGSTSLPDGATFFLELWFDGALARTQKVRVANGRILARDRDAPPSFGPFPGLELLDGRYEVVASVVPGTMAPAVRARLAPEVAQVPVARTTTHALVGSDAVARRERAQAERELRADVASLRSAAAALRDAYGSATRSFWPLDKEGRFPTDEWVRWVHEKRNDLLDPPGGKGAVRRVFGWLSDTHFVDTHGRFVETTWRHFLDDDLRPKVAALRKAAKARVDGVVMPRFPRAQGDLDQGLALLARLSSDLSHEVYRMNHLELHANDATSRDLELVAAPTTSAYGYLLQLADAVDRGLDGRPAESPGK